MNKYCMFKGSLVNAAPFKSEYVGNPHYVIRVADAYGNIFKIVVNAASTQIGADGNSDVYTLTDMHFEDSITEKLDAMKLGLYTDGFPRLDYWQDSSLLDLHKMRPIPYADENGDRSDVNDVFNTVLTIDDSAEPTPLPYDGGKGDAHDRDFFAPTESNVIVYGFGFLFQPAEDGLHETHMNQGNPKGPHYKENGAFQDGAVIIQRSSGFAAIFTAFQTQYLPTDTNGNPTKGAVALTQYVSNS